MKKFDLDQLNELTYVTDPLPPLTVREIEESIFAANVCRVIGTDDFYGVLSRCRELGMPLISAGDFQGSTS